MSINQFTRANPFLINRGISEPTNIDPVTGVLSDYIPDTTISGATTTISVIKSTPNSIIDSNGWEEFINTIVQVPVYKCQKIVLITSASSSWSAAMQSGQVTASFNNEGNITGFTSNPNLPSLPTTVDSFIQTLNNYSISMDVISTDTDNTLSQLVNGTNGTYYNASTAADVVNVIVNKIPQEIVTTCPENGFTPISGFTISTYSYGVPNTLTFTNTTTGDNLSQIAYSWSFGDGTFSDSSNTTVTHTYTEEGIYTVGLLAVCTLKDTLASQTTNTVTIAAVPVAPIASFSANILQGQLPCKINFTDTSTGFYDTWLWDFGDGGHSTVQNPIYTYNRPGIWNVTLTITDSLVNLSSTSQSTSIYTWVCSDIHVKIDISITVLEIWEFSYSLLNSVSMTTLLYSFDSFRDKCLEPYNSQVQYLPKGLKPISILSLIYYNIQGQGRYYVPYKIGENVLWDSTGLLEYEPIDSADGYGVKLTFNSKVGLTGPVTPGTLVAPLAGPYTFNKGNNVLGIETPDNMLKLITFPVYDKDRLTSTGAMSLTYTGTTTYSVIEVCGIINDAYATGNGVNGDILVIPDTYGRMYLVSMVTGYLKIVGFDRGSTANSIFGFDNWGSLGIPRTDLGNVNYTIALNLTVISDDTSLDSTQIESLLGIFRVVDTYFSVYSTNAYRYMNNGSYPSTISNKIYLPPGHRYLTHLPLILSSITEYNIPPSISPHKPLVTFSESTNTIGGNPLGTTMNISQWGSGQANAYSLFSPYWNNMVMDASFYNNNCNLWTWGDDKRLYSQRKINTIDNSIEMINNYDFLAPPPTVKNMITAPNSEPYTLPYSPARNRFLSLRKITLSASQSNSQIVQGNAVTPEFINYTPATETLQMNFGYLTNTLNPGFDSVVYSAPIAIWNSDNSPVNITSPWTGLGSSSIQCIFDSTGHSGDTMTLYFYLSTGILEETQSDDWIYVELPYGNNLTANELILAMQRQDNTLRSMGSTIQYTPSCATLDNSGNLIDPVTKIQSNYQFFDYNGRLGIRVSVDYDYRLRLGGIPELCYANSVFGWNALGEVGNSADLLQGPYYLYNYRMRSYVTQEMSDSLDGNDVISSYSPMPFNYSKSYSSNAFKIKMNNSIMTSQYTWDESGNATLVPQVVEQSFYLTILTSLLKDSVNCKLNNPPGVTPPVTPPGTSPAQPLVNTNITTPVVPSGGGKINVPVVPPGGAIIPVVAVPSKITVVSPVSPGTSKPGTTTITLPVPIIPGTNIVKLTTPTSTTPGTTPGTLAGTLVVPIGTIPTSSGVIPRPSIIPVPVIPIDPPDGPEPVIPIIVPCCISTVKVSNALVPISTNISLSCKNQNNNSIFSNTLVNDFFNYLDSDPFLSLISSLMLSSLVVINKDKYKVQISNLIDQMIANNTPFNISDITSSNFPIFSTSNITEYLQTLQASINLNLDFDFYHAVNDLATFTLRFVETYNSKGLNEGVTYSLPVVSTLESVFKVVTIANMDIFNSALSLSYAKIHLGPSTEVFPLYCDPDTFYTMYPMVLNMNTGTLNTLPSFIIHPCGCNDNFQITLNTGSTDSTISIDCKNLLLLRKVTNYTIYVSMIKYFIVDCAANPLNLSFTFNWDSETFITGLEIDEGAGYEPSTATSIKEIKTDYINKVMTITFCDVSCNKSHVISGPILQNCYPLSNPLTYNFYSTYHGNISVEMPKVSSLMVDNVILTLSEALIPFKVSLTNNMIVIDPGNYSIKLVSITGMDIFGMKTVVDYDRQSIVLTQNDLQYMPANYSVGQNVMVIKTKIYYAYLNT